jgi:hypothetical protein
MQTKERVIWASDQPILQKKMKTLKVDPLINLLDHLLLQFRSGLGATKRASFLPPSPWCSLEDYPVCQHIIINQNAYTRSPNMSCVIFRVVSYIIHISWDEDTLQKTHPHVLPISTPAPLSLSPRHPTLLASSSPRPTLDPATSPTPASRAGVDMEASGGSGGGHGESGEVCPPPPPSCGSKS